MKILSSAIKASFNIKKSNFHCFAHFINNRDDVKNIINKYKKKYYDADHVCYAYILDDNTYYFSDGGEPSGTAGKPLFGALQSFKLNYTLIVVVRYFGGIKFGTSLLKNTFKDIAIKTLNLSKFKDCQIADIVKIKVSYDKLKQVSLIIKHLLHKKEYKQEHIVMSLIGNKDSIITCLNRLGIKPISIMEKQII